MTKYVYYHFFRLYALLQELRDHYNEVLMQSWVKRFRDIFDKDTYTPIQVTTITEYQDIIGKKHALSDITFKMLVVILIVFFFSLLRSTLAIKRFFSILHN